MSTFIPTPGDTIVTHYYFLISGLVSPAFSTTPCNSMSAMTQYTGQELLTYSSSGLGNYYGMDTINDMGMVVGGVPMPAVTLTYGHDSPSAGQLIVGDIPAHNFLFGWDKASRILWTSPNDPGFDFVITSVTLTLIGLNGYDGVHKPVLRIYNASSNGEAYGASITIDPSIAGTLNGQTASTNVVCALAPGANIPENAAVGPNGRTVIIDLYNPLDDLGPSNAVGVNWGNNGGIVFTYKSLN
jgi:hypothetical protein